MNSLFLLVVITHLYYGNTVQVIDKFQSLNDCKAAGTTLVAEVKNMPDGDANYVCLEEKR